MSLINRIAKRTVDDVVNQGYRVVVAGSVAGGSTTAIQSGVSKRLIGVCSFVLTSDNATGGRVTLSFKKSGSSTVNIFDGYVAAGGPVSHSFMFGDEHYGEELFDLVLVTTGTGNVGYSVSTRIVGVQTPTGFVYNS